MEEYFVTLEIAKQLKELGFNLPCLGSFELINNKFKLCMVGQPNDYQINTTEDFKDDFDENSLFAPMWEQVFDWLESEHQILAHITMHERGGNYGDWKYEIYKYRPTTENEYNKTCAYHVKVLLTDGGFWETKSKTRKYCIIKALSFITKNI